MPNLWSKTYVAGDDFQSPDAYLPFVRATNERLRATGRAPIDETAVAGTNMLAGSYSLPHYTAGPGPMELVRPAGLAGALASWSALQCLVVNLLLDFVDAALPVAGFRSTDYNAYAAAHAAYYGLNPDVIGPYLFVPTLWYQYPAWPNGTGFTRVREREITSLSVPGTAGQRARFIYSLTGQEDDGTPPAFFGAVPTQPPTPAAERQYSLQVMLYAGGAWAVDPDQLTPPDAVTFYGLAQAGDVMGPWILNELRDAINALEVSKLQYDWTDGGQPNYRRADSNVSQADCEAQWAATAATTRAYDGNYATMRSRIGGGFGGGNWTLEVSQAYATVSPPSFCNRQVSFVNYANDANFGSGTRDPADFDADGQPVAVADPTYLDDGGNPREEELFVWSTSAVTNATVVTSAAPLGDVTVRPAWKAAGGHDNYGFIVHGDSGTGEACALIDWAVAGGFQYTSASP